MKIGLNITTYNRKLFSEQCIKSVLWSEPEDVSIAIVDNNSTDGTQEMLAEYQKANPIIEQVVYNEKNRHIGAAINQGWTILSAHCDILGEIPNDVFAEPGWDQNILACFGEMGFGHMIGFARRDREKLRQATPSGKGHYSAPRDLGGCSFIKTEHFLNGFKWIEGPWGKGNVGPMPGFHRMIKRGFGDRKPLTGARLASPGFLARKCEYTNPDYAEYYNKTHGERSLLTELNRRKKLESEGKGSQMSADLRHSINWKEFLSIHYPERIDAGK